MRRRFRSDAKPRALACAEVVIGIDDFLRSGNTSRAEVIAAIESQVELGRDDVLLAAGSLAEGLGTGKSDLDLFLITARDAASGERDEIILAAGSRLVDLRILSRRRVAGLLGRLRDWGLAQWDPSEAASFSHDERVLMHRLAHGLDWTSPSRGALPGDSFRPPLHELSLLKLHVARHAARTVQVDLEGYRQAGDYRTMAFAAQKLLGHAVDGLLAGHHLTNPISKWRSRLLARLPDDWEAELSCRRLGSSAPDLYWRLQKFPDWPDGRVIPYAERILAVSRAIFLWAEMTLLGLPVRLGRTSFRRTRSGSPDVPLPPLLADVDFSLRPTGAMAARLNEFAEVLHLSFEELSMALLFDGITTSGEAARACHPDLASDEAARRVDALARRLAAAGLCGQSPMPAGRAALGLQE